MKAAESVEIEIVRLAHGRDLQLPDYATASAAGRSLLSRRRCRVGIKIRGRIWPGGRDGIARHRDAWGSTSSTTTAAASTAAGSARAEVPRRARDTGRLRMTDRQRVDVERAPAEEGGDAVQDARFVFDVNDECMEHMRISAIDDL